MTSSNSEECPVPLSTAEKAEVWLEIKDFIIKHPIDLAGDEAPICSQVDCYCRVDLISAPALPL